MGLPIPRVKYFPWIKRRGIHSGHFVSRSTNGKRFDPQIGGKGCLNHHYGATHLEQGEYPFFLASPKDIGILPPFRYSQYSKWYFLPVLVT